MLRLAFRNVPEGLILLFVVVAVLPLVNTPTISQPEPTDSYEPIADSEGANG